MRLRWRPGITARLFLAILAVCALTASGMGLATRLSFQSGFRDYLAASEQERVKSLAAEVGEEFAQAGNWNSLREAKNWRRLVYRFTRLESETKKKPPRRTKSGDGEGDKVSARMERARRDWARAQLRSSIGLVGADKVTLIAGMAPSPDAFWHPVEDDGAVIGWLTHEPLTDVIDNLALRFEDEQLRAGLIISLFSLVLAAVVAMLMARTLIAPLRRFAATTGRLAAGDFSARVSPAPPLFGKSRTATEQADDGAGHDNAGQDDAGQDDARPDELQLLAAQLNHLADALEANEQARRAFMAEVAHDLRTPLSILRGEIEALEDGLRPFSAESLGSLRAEVELLGRLVDDIQTLSLADLGTLAYNRMPMDLVVCLRTSLSSAQERIAARGLALESALPQEPLPVLADAARLTQALRNVLENSLRYTDAGGCIRVSCRRENALAIIDVMDSPPAVPEHQLALLFERFHTGDAARNRGRSGSGLGLAICKTLVEAHAGSVRALPSPLGGLWIRITLPLLARYGESS